jgi:hypothetical protein
MPLMRRAFYSGMSVRLFNARRLAKELGRGEIPARVKSYYLFASLAMWLVIHATGLVRASALWSWISYVETTVLLLITVLGLSYAYDAGGGDENADFVSQFICLYVPVSITTVVVVWGVYWCAMYLFRESLDVIADNRLRFAIYLSRIGGTLSDALGFLAAIATEAIIFFRVTRLFHVLRYQRQASSSPLEVPASGPA